MWSPPLLNYHPTPQEALYHRTQWPQACHHFFPFFARLVLAYPKDITGPLLDALQFAYWANRSVNDAVNGTACTTSYNTMTLHGHTKGSCLWTSARQLTPSAQNSSAPNPPSSLYQPPPVSDHKPLESRWKQRPVPRSRFNIPRVSLRYLASLNLVFPNLAMSTFT